MDESSEDRISNLAESVVCHILSRLPTKDAVRTSVLSKDWEHKWTSIYNVRVDDESKSFINSEPFGLLGDRTPHLTWNRRVKRSCLSREIELGTCPPRRLLTDVLMHGTVQNIEINSNKYWGTTFTDALYSCKSLIKLKLSLNCTLNTSLMKNCFLNLKILHLGRRVYLSDHEPLGSGQVVMNFPVLEELELRNCGWWGVNFVEINAPALLRFLIKDRDESLWHDYLIKINGPKLEKFESCDGTLENLVFTAPSVSNAVLISYKGDGIIGFRARAILKGFPALEYLEMSCEIAEALTRLDANFRLPCFNKLKQLELINNISYGALFKLIQRMPSLETLSLCVYNYGCTSKILEYFPSGVASRLKVVKLDGFEGTSGQIQLAKSVLENVENLEKLIVSVWFVPFMPINEIEHLLSSSPKSSTHASVEVELRLNSETMCDRISNLHDSVVCHILSRLPTTDAMRTSILSKDWEHKWTSIYNIQLDNRKEMKFFEMNKGFAYFVDRTLRLTRNSRLKSFCLIYYDNHWDSHSLKTWIPAVLMRGVQNLQIETYELRPAAFVNELYKCRSLTELKLFVNCTLVASRMNNSFPDLKILKLGNKVKFSKNEVSDKLLLNFPVLEELGLRQCEWPDVKFVEIIAPALLRLLVESGEEKDYEIKIDGGKLEKFECRGQILENFVFTAPSVLHAALTGYRRRASFRLQDRAIMKGFPNLECLKVSRAIFEALTDFPLPCFTRLKQLVLYDMINDEARLMKLVQVMPTLESLSLYVNKWSYHDYKGLESLPLAIASRLKVVELDGFAGATDQINLVKFVLKNAEKLEKLIVSIADVLLMPKVEVIKHLLKTFAKSSTRA